jgi:hypothetical protein
VLMRKTLSPPAWSGPDVTPAGIAVAGGAAVIVGTALAAALVRPEDEVLRVALMAIALAVFAATSARPIVMVALVPLSWLVVNGFLVDRYGVLAWHGRADLYRLLALATAAGAGLIVREARRG